jgi:predicted O-methyltransferase YrrM
MIEKCPDNAFVLNELIKKYKFTKGAELGVRRGEFTTYLLENNSALNMICVDIWDNHVSLNENHPHDENYNTFLNNIESVKDRVKVIRKLTNIACDDVEDLSLDFIFIDATHTYSAVKQDMNKWAPKVKVGGLICGHDYNPAFDNGGIIRAVNELLPNIAEFKRVDSISINNEVIIESLDILKGAADSATGCWYVWKN